MPALLSLLEALCLIAISLVCLRILVGHLTAWRVLAAARRLPDPPGGWPGVSLIKPVRGLDEEADANLASFLGLDYPGKHEVLFCVEEERDPAVPVIRRLLRTHPEAEARLLVRPRSNPGILGKIHNMMVGVEASRHPVLLFSDADVRAGAGYVQDLVRPLADPRVGLAFGAPVVAGGQTAAAGLLALAVNDAILLIAPAVALQRVEGACGASMAIRRETLEAVGGLAPFAGQIADDAALGRAVRRAGLQIALTASPIRIIQRRTSLRQWWSLMHRWFVTVRRLFPALYACYPLAEFGFLWGVLYAALRTAEGADGIVWLLPFGMAALAAASMAVLCLRFARTPEILRWLWLLPALDLLRAAVWVAAYLSSEVSWRGRRLRVLRGGLAVPVEQ
ncbi:MAG TPA: glycosyltransferase [Candidatus Methylomirabilis sp.]|nr:glycosyltransferase [Candidatus Methylomirabilis sp.]